MTLRFIVLTRHEAPTKVLIHLRAVSHIEANPVDGETGSIVYFSGMEDDYVAVAESYATILALLGWGT